jgi:hypothetical protein
MYVPLDCGASNGTDVIGVYAPFCLSPYNSNPVGTKCAEVAEACQPGRGIRHDTRGASDHEARPLNA